MWRLALLLPLTMLLTASIPGGDGQGAVLRAQAVPLDPSAPGTRRIGALTYLGGWELSSDDPHFGGISSLRKGAEGFTALTDAGVVLRFDMPRRQRPGTLAVAPLPGSSSALRRDSESLAWDPATKRSWVGIEAENAVVRYGRDFSRVERDVRPAAMRGWPANGGPESLVRLRDGRFLVISEEKEIAPGVRQALLFAGDPVDAGGEVVSFGYRPPNGYVPTDAVELPNGRLLVLNRRFRMLEGVSAVLVALDLGTPNAGSVVSGQEVARLRPPVTVDNMEALALEREAGRAILWMASDDNFSPLQRTLLLKFALD